MATREREKGLLERSEPKTLGEWNRVTGEDLEETSE